MQPIELSTERLLLDQPTTRDVRTITEACQDPIFERFMTLPWPYQTEHAAYFVATVAPEGWDSGREATWALRPRSAPSELLGMISVRADTNDIGYWLVPSHRGRGYMTEAVEGVVGWAMETRFCGSGPIRWSCTPGNVASAGVARKAGLRYTGVGPSPIAMRDGTYPDSWLGEHVGLRDPDQWPRETFTASRLAKTPA
ncbi:GNAT family N-acetyltransferase [Subtercola endophyticus]|uniref:GNAT family N-acetyltransferase n=1 Tax=Subtercola endophyticus TaxID=2895559 RepID=UPI001E4A55CE|nr:GNAT family N-acetyltransferase [Subtercola endophyticus]UFS60660.1 GNAT family N-acetyltransferase [Subtercola endophyticus]